MAKSPRTVGLWEELATIAHYDANELAKLCHLSVRQLERQFRYNLDQSPQDWLDERRLMAAQRMLLTGQMVKVVALGLSFKQVSHFCRQFKSQYGLTPSKFAKKD
jgi:AraC family transcriptional regulator